MDLGIRNHVAIVTGGGNGIGAACALALAQEGVRVAVADRDLQAAQRVAAGICSRGLAAQAVQMDVSQPASVRESIAAVLDHWGQVQILVNNAGFSRDNAIEAMTDDEWSQVIAVNLTGQFNCARVLAPLMAAQGYGRIVNMASRAHLGDVNKANYSAAKAGVIGMTKALAIELGPAGVTVNAVAPGVVQTDRLGNLPHFDALRDRAMAAMPIKRLGRPEEVAQAVAFLASSNAGFITGEVIHITGGRYG